MMILFLCNRVGELLSPSLNLREVIAFVITAPFIQSLCPQHCNAEYYIACLSCWSEILLELCVINDKIIALRTLTD